MPLSKCTSHLDSKSITGSLILTENIYTQHKETHLYSPEIENEMKRVGSPGSLKAYTVEVQSVTSLSF